MKGTIIRCLAEMVTEQFGQEKWQTVLEKAGLKPATHFLPYEDIDDASAMKIVEAACQTLNLSLAQAAEAFGDYWSTIYAPRMYKPFYAQALSAKEFLLQLNQVHVAMTKNMPGARPPRFEYEWKGNVLIMQYNSPRGLIDFAVGLAKGVGKHYHTHLKITRQGHDRIEIVFPAEP